MQSRFCPIASRLPACCLATLLSVALAQADDAASRQLRDQQQSLRQREQQRRLDRWQHEPPPPRDTVAHPDETRAVGCWRVSGARLAGNRSLSTQALEPSIKAFLQPCMDVATINQLLKAITQRYVQAGYPTSRPYLQHYPRHDAPLDIVIVEGFVESIELDADLPLSLQSAFPDMLGRPLYLPALEQGLDQLNRLRAYTLSADLLPGQQPGGTRVALQARQVAARWHLDSRLDNRGSALTGRHRLNLGIGLDSPLGLNDDLRLSLLSSVINAPGRSQGLSLHYSLPYGPWTFALDANQLSYSAPIPHGRQRSSGRSRHQGASAERVLWRNKQGMLGASVRLDRKQVINRTGAVVIELQSPSLTVVEAGLNLLWLDDGLWHAYLGIAQGTGWLGAGTRLPRDGAPRADFRKYRASLLRLRQGPADRPWRWQSELALQYSRDVLPAVEQLQLSDDSAVRGFRQRSYGGASAVVWRNTLSQALHPVSTWPLQVRPSIGLDLGWSRPAAGHSATRLAGAAAGVELSLRHNRLRLDYQRALYASDLSRRLPEPGIWVLEWSSSL